MADIKVAPELLGMLKEGPEKLVKSCMEELSRIDVQIEIREREIAGLKQRQENIYKKVRAAKDLLAQLDKAAPHSVKEESTPDEQPLLTETGSPQFSKDHFRHDHSHEQYRIEWPTKSQIIWILYHHNRMMTVREIANEMYMKDNSIELTSDFRSDVSSHCAQLKKNYKLLSNEPAVAGQKAKYGLNREQLKR